MEKKKEENTDPSTGKIEIKDLRDIFETPQLHRHQRKAYLTTIIAYGVMCICRTTYSYSKDTVINTSNEKLTKPLFGYIDLAWSICLAIGAVSGGRLGDKVSPPKLLFLSFLSLSIFFSMLPVSQYFNFNNVYVWCVFQGFIGLFQGFVFPLSACLLGRWLTKKRVLLMGLWPVARNIGNIVGQAIATISLDRIHWTWPIAFFFGAGCCLIMSIFQLLVSPSPESENIPMPPTYSKQEEQEHLNDDGGGTPTIQIQRNIGLGSPTAIETPTTYIPPKPDDKGEEISWFRSWLIPGVFIYAASNLFLKAIAFGLLFWLALQLKEQNLKEQSSQISIVYECGGLIGAISIANLMHHFTKRSTTIGVFLFVASVFFIILQFVKSNDFSFSNKLSFLFVMLFLTGISIGAPLAIFPMIIGVDMGKNPILAKSKKAQATVCGNIEFAGNIGSSIFQKVIPYLGTWLFMGCFVQSVLSLLIIGWIIKKEICQKKEVKKSENYEMKITKDQSKDDSKD